MLSTSLKRSIQALLVSLIGSLAVTLTAAQRPSLDEGSTGLALALRRLPVTGSIMEITAHPDDEDNALFVTLRRGLGFRTGLLTLTRGDGGQNEIGSELFEALGIIRTEELMSMHKIDGAEQFFTRAYEFGYSFSVDETLEKWGRTPLLQDIVRVIRTFRPDVLLTLSRRGEGGGQHHQASAILALEAFRLAGDPKVFPEQLAEGLRPWSPKKIYESARRNQSEGEGSPTVRVNAGAYDPILGRTHYELGVEARSSHRCQGMNQLAALPVERFSQWRLVESLIEVNEEEESLFDGIDTSLFALEEPLSIEGVELPFFNNGLIELQELIEQANQAYRPDAFDGVAAPLASGLKLLADLKDGISRHPLPDETRQELFFSLGQKEKDFSDALRLALQVRIEVILDDGLVTPGQTFQVTANLFNGGKRDLDLTGSELQVPQGWSYSPVGEGLDRLLSGRNEELVFQVRVSPRAELSEPYWERDPDVDRFKILKPEVHTLPWEPPPLSFRSVVSIQDLSVPFQKPAEYRYVGPWVGGEQRHALIVVPALSLRVRPDIAILPLNQSKDGREVRVEVTYNDPGPAQGRLDVQAPPEWTVVPAGQEFEFQSEGEKITARFRVYPPAQVSPGPAKLRFLGRLGTQVFDKGYQVIDYHHIEKRHLYRPAEATVKVMQVEVPNSVTVGYVDGVGDHVPAALGQLGIPTVFLDEDALAFGDLDQFQVIITGVRAYFVRDDLKRHNRRLLDWVSKGGTLIVQYNKFEFNGPRKPESSDFEDSPFSPYPAKIGRGRVTDEAAPIQLLHPEDQAFLFPNRIQEQDWGGWVQERGLYFLGEKDGRYRDLVSVEDPFPYNRGTKLGALVVTEVGEGKWVYVGLGLWRQLPAGVEGAFRLLSNLVALGESRN